MYALFYEDTGELIATADRPAHAVGLAQLASREKGRPVVGVFNGKDGTTDVCWRFENGIQMPARARPN